MCPVQFSGDCAGSWLWHAVPCNLHTTAESLITDLLHQAVKYFHTFIEKWLYCRTYFFYVNGCIQGAVICVNSIFQLWFFFFFTPIFSAVILWTVKQDKSCWNSGYKAMGCWRISQCVCVNNLDVYMSTTPHYGSIGVAKQPMCYTGVCITMQVIYCN